ncbi:hypothetical protein GCM10020331_090970 [Ectobacillus funiculus]
MKTWHYALIVFLGGCCYGVLSTFVKLAYSAGYSVTEVTGGQYLFGTLLIWVLVLFTKKENINFKSSFQTTIIRNSIWPNRRVFIISHYKHLMLRWQSFFYFNLFGLVHFF